MSKTTYTIINEATRQDCMRHIDNEKHYVVTVEEVTDKNRRTVQQNAALHLDFKNTAEACNEAGLTAASMFAIPREDSEVTPELVKEFWHNVLVNMGMEPKTSKLTTAEVTVVREAIERAFAMRRGVDIGNFPSLESMCRESLVKF